MNTVIGEADGLGLRIVPADGAVAFADTNDLFNSCELLERLARNRPGFTEQIDFG